jgi:hypothetical protein
VTISTTREFTDFPPPQYGGKLVIFTPFYEGRAFAGYTHSLALTAMVLEKLGIKWDYWLSSGDFHVERAINKALTNFLESDYTDFVCIDSDEAWNPDGLLRLVAHDEAIVGGAYRKKNRWTEWTATLQLDDARVPKGKITKTGPLLQADRLPFGFLRLTKQPLLKYREKFPERWYHDTADDKDQTPIKVTQFITTQLRDHQFFSQDFAFSEDMKSLGYQLWLEPNITIGHFGLVEHIGNLDKYLRDLKAEQSRTPMENIQAFVKDQTRSAA